MPDESLLVRRKIGLKRGYDGCQHASDALTRQNLVFRHRQKKAEKYGPGQLRVIQAAVIASGYRSAVADSRYSTSHAARGLAVQFCG